MAANVRGWLSDRAHLTPETYQALNREVPKGVGWLNTLGSVALGILLLQAITGTVLAMYYSGHPDAAYESVSYIDRHLPLGRLVHGMHRYADSVLVVVLLIHILRTYVQAAYKAPRELIWLSGVVLLTLTLGFGFTGFLLPWDQNAYWATHVRTQYAAGVPVVGPMLLLLLRGAPSVGASTITRFYALHVIVLPALVGLVLVPHLALAWKKGATAPGVPVGEETPAHTRFLEHQVLRHITAVLVAFGVIVALATFFPVELEFKANPADATYHAHPEWYFMFLFQLVSNFGKLPVVGKLSWLPVVVIPGAAMTFLALAPWIDRGPHRHPRARRTMMGALVLGVAGILVLSLQGFGTTHANATPANSVYGHYTRGGEDPLPANLVADGKTAFAQCGGCHAAYGDYNGKAGPDLTGYGIRTIPLGALPNHPEMEHLPFYDRFVKFVRGDLRPAQDRMPKYPAEALSQEQLDAIGAYLSQSPVKRAPAEHVGSPSPNQDRAGQ